MSKKIIKEKIVLKRSIKVAISKILILIIVFLLGMISTKLKPSLKSQIEQEVYKKSFSFIKTRTLYNKYFGTLISTIKEDAKPVVSNKISYKGKKEIENGIILEVEENYPISCLANSIVIMLDDNKIVLEQDDGVIVTYKNIKTNNYKLYDYLDKEDIIGETNSKELIILFEKEGEQVDYNKYL